MMQRTTNVLRYVFAMTALCSGFWQAGCSRDSGTSTEDSGLRSDAEQSDDAQSDDQNAFRFAVVSDPHYYDNDLGVTGEAFDAYLALDRKMLAESSAILYATLETLVRRKDELDFVIIPGDLTKDGERTCHEEFIARIRLLEENGLQVYLCPGNHDINNPDARSFDGDTVSQVPSVTPEEFVELYADFGYEQAIERDPGSLSYLVEPVDGLWVIAIDSCKYQDNLSMGISQIGGALNESTLRWIEEKLAEAADANKLVFGFMHHGLVEHFTNQSTLPKLGDEYVVDDWRVVSQRLAEAGLRLVFTGHYHAQDITKQSWQESGQFLFDVQTGSLVTYPNPFRTITFGTDGEVEVASYFVKFIDYDTGELGFQDYSRQFITSGIDGLALTYLTLFGLSEQDAEQVRPIAVESLVAHYAGDENPSAQSRQQVEDFIASSNAVVSLVAGYLKSLQTDLPPPDNEVTFNIKTGEIELK
jgi:3',5'-cyclic AMP phosphodiesterase CpdA